MKTLARADLDRSLRESISPLYLLLGSESYLRDTAAQAIADTGDLADFPCGPYATIALIVQRKNSFRPRRPATPFFCAN